MKYATILPSAQPIWESDIMAQSLLTVKNLRAGYAGSTVIDGISFELQQGEALLVMGRNGVGKTTLLETLMGLTRQIGGEITFNAQKAAGLSPRDRSRCGIGWVPQSREIFPSLTVEENINVALRPGRWNRERIYDLFPRLLERRRNYGNQLSGGEQQMLALGRALATNPKLLLLDEPVEGLAPVIVSEMMAAIGLLRQSEQMSMIIVEQKYSLALPICDQVMVLDHGNVVFGQSAAEAIAAPDHLSRLIAVG